MTEPLTLTLGQRFEIERFSRVIDETSDLQALRDIAKRLLNAWQGQKAATLWVMRQPPFDPINSQSTYQEFFTNDQPED